MTQVAPYSLRARVVVDQRTRPPTEEELKLIRRFVSSFLTQTGVLPLGVHPVVGVDDVYFMVIAQ